MINTTKIFLVIPTIRDLEFLKSWGKEFNDCHLIVVEDHPDKQIKIPSRNFKSISHFTWEDIDRDLGKDGWIIPRFNSGVRSYGFWKAYKMGASAIISIDDDCYPGESNFVDKHLDNLHYKTPVKWINTYPNPKWMFTRGFPYAVRNKIPVHVSHGIWSGALDLDAKTEVKLKSLLKEELYGPLRNYIPQGFYYPMCSMNFGFTRKVTPLMYFPMMGKKRDGTNWDYDRYDDIWAGIFSKKIMDHLNLGVISGSPQLVHKKASKPTVNHKKERSGMVANEKIWKIIDAVKLTSTTPKECYLELSKKADFPKTKYFVQLRKAMDIWANLF